MSNVDFGNRRQLFVAVKGAPETLKGMYKDVPGNYDETYKWFTRRGSRVLALGYKYLESLGEEKVSFFWGGWWRGRGVSRSSYGLLMSGNLGVGSVYRSASCRGKTSKVDSLLLGSWCSTVP